MNGIISTSRITGAYKPFDPCRGQHRSEIFTDDYVPPNIEPDLQVGAVYQFGRRSRGTQKNKQYEDKQACGARYNFEGAEMVYLGKTGAGYLFQSVANQWNKGCFSAAELREHKIKHIA